MTGIETYRTRLKQFLPTFIEENEILDALLYAIANEKYKIFTEIEALPDSDWTGAGLLLTINDNRLFTNQTNIFLKYPDGTYMLAPDGNFLSIRNADTETVLQERLKQRYDFWKQRGSTVGIKQDLESLFGLEDSTLEFKDYTQSGIIGDVTYFGDGNFVGANKFLTFTPKDRFYITRNIEHDKLIKKYIIPIDAEILIKDENNV